MLSESPNVQILETLGEGSFGEVYVARLYQGGVERTVALKMLKGEWIKNAEVLSRYRDEARLLAMLNHPFIVRVDQLTILWGRPTIVMEYVPGASLLGIMKRGPMPLSVVMTVAQRVAGALHAAYNRPPPGQDKPLHVVHRDIKPSNILIGIDGEVKILDFGTARGEFDARESKTQFLGFGSMGYLAPERMEGAVRGPAIDIYSLGITLYEILAGKRLGRLHVRPDKHDAQVFDAVGQLAIYQGDMEADRRTRNLILHMLAWRPERRPQALDVLLCAEEILRCIPSPQHISTEAYAREEVLNIYQNRQIVQPPADLVGSTLKPDELAVLTEVLPLKPVDARRLAGLASAEKGEPVDDPRTFPLDPAYIRRRAGFWAPLRETWRTAPAWLRITTLILVTLASASLGWRALQWRYGHVATVAPVVTPAPER